MSTLSIAEHRIGFEETSGRNEAHSSGVSWAAVIAGAFVAAALSLILLTLGAGIGLSSISPWSNAGASASAIGTMGIVWLIVMELVSSAVGGYLAGRLRTKWATIHTDEVFFRDTAHGFLVWAVGVVITASLLASAAASAVGRGSQVATTALSAGAAQSDLGSNGYFVDMLFRSSGPASAIETNPTAGGTTTSALPGSNDVAVRAEAERIFVHALRQGDFSGADRAYLAQIVAAQTGLSQSDAERRVSDDISAAQQSADTARKAAAHFSYWLFLALLIGAFCASFAATIGGRQRDHVRMV
jgi:hypothetical protein